MPAGVSAWTPLANITLGSATTTVTFSSISSAHRDLVLIVRGGNSSSNYYQVRFNGDSSGSYNWLSMFRQGSSSIFSNGAANATRILFGINGNSSALGSSIGRLEIFDYATTNKHKQVILRNDDIDNNSTGELTAYRYAQTTAITSIEIVATSSTTMPTGTTIALYGVAQ
jgi:hypothetical protein